ncbi:MAG: peptidoglycan DD-metalloendopeptidase family protein [bacterium]
MALAESNIGPNVTDNTDSDISNVSISDTTLTPKVGPLGSNLDVAEIPAGGGQIIVYTVHDGDTLSSVAKMFDISKATIINANDLSTGQSLKPGTILAIPPVSGYIHTVKKGETINSIAKKYKVTAIDIAVYNDLDVESVLTPDNTLIIPDETASVDTSKTSDQSTKTAPTQTKQPSKSTTTTKTNKDTSNTKAKITAHPMRVNTKVDLGNALLRPVSISSSYESQGAHGIFGSSVDLAAPAGTPIYASADGTVVLALSTGWNGGYGKYVIVMSTIDGNVVQYIDAHMSEVLTNTGDHVSRGQIIGKVGRTGNATGNHVHFEVHGALNPLTIDPNYTGE